MTAPGSPRSPLAGRLRRARTAKGISQRQLGISIGIDPSSASPRLNQYENDRHVPDFRIAERLAAELDVPVTYFYAEDDRLADMILAFEALPPRKRAKALRAVQDQSNW